MPSRFEPCGLNQLFSMRYGTVPIAHATGGLRDTIANYDPNASGGLLLVHSAVCIQQRLALQLHDLMCPLAWSALAYTLAAEPVMGTLRCLSSQSITGRALLLVDVSGSITVCWQRCPFV